MIQFDQKIYFYALVLLPLMLLVFLGVQLWKKKTQNNFSDTALLKKLAPKKSTFKAPFKFTLLQHNYTLRGHARRGPIPRRRQQLYGRHGDRLRGPTWACAAHGRRRAGIVV